MNWRIGLPIKHELWWLTDGYVGRWTPSAPPLSLIKLLIKNTIYWACLFLSPILSPIQCLSVAILRNGRPPYKYSPITETHRGRTALYSGFACEKPYMEFCTSGFQSCCNSSTFYLELNQYRQSRHRFIQSKRNLEIPLIFYPSITFTLD